MISATYHIAATLALSCTFSTITYVAYAAESDFLDRFQGTWSGSGVVQREGQSNPRHVTCSVTGDPTRNRLNVQGQCRAAIIFSRGIGAELIYDPQTGTYQGVYTGSRIGPARLTGRRSGDTVKLSIKWPRPVNGDTQAAMTIWNDGEGALRITVADNLTPGGPVQKTSEIVLRRDEQ